MPADPTPTRAQAEALSKELAPGFMHAKRVKIIESALLAARRDALEEAAKFIEAHRATHHSHDGWYMDPTDEPPDKVQQCNAAAIRALKETP